MKTAVADLWKLHATGSVWVVVPTNGVTAPNGHAVMGKGVAKDAAARFRGLTRALGTQLLLNGNHVYPFPEYRIFTFPTKNDWREPSSIELIRQSTEELSKLSFGLLVALPHVGCGEGGLNWNSVYPVLSEILDDRFLAVQKEEELPVEELEFKW